MRWFSCLCLVTLLGCGSNTTTTVSRFHEDGRAKPAISIVPVIDTTICEVPWSLSEELTSLIATRLSQEGSLYSVLKEETSFTENPFGSDLSWVKRAFPNEKFVLFLELAEHSQQWVLKENASDASLIPPESALSLKMAVKIRVVDLREETPKIALQEVITVTNYDPNSALPIDYAVVTWGTEAYQGSPMRLAHLQIAQQIAIRVREYVSLAHSR